MPTLVEKLAVQRLLIQLGKAGKFYAVSYDVNDLPVDIDLDAVVPPTVVVPASCHANEVACSFEEDARYGQGRILARGGWSWDLMCDFNQEVTAWAAEEEWLATPPRLDRDVAAGIIHGAILDLTSTEPQHPPVREPHSGSRFRFTFNARPARR